VAGALLAELVGDAAVGQPGVLHSSLGVPFALVSDIQLVAGIDALGRAECVAQAEALARTIKELEAERAVLLADFEGEMPGFGGELMTAAFLPTLAVDARTLDARTSPPEVQSAKGAAPAGLLLDLRAPAGRFACRRIMESPAIVKVIWGAHGDLTSLRHQELPHAFRIMSRGVVDAQLAFSRADRRMGMARMLSQVPQELLAELPKKDVIDFDGYHALNLRALALPLEMDQARYAVDDLHRLEAVLVSQMPAAGSYGEACAATEEEIRRIEDDPDGLAWLQSEMIFFERKYGVPRQAKAVQLARHLMLLRSRGAEFGDQEPFVSSVEATVFEDLTRAGVQIPADLSFGVGLHPAAR